MDYIVLFVALLFIPIILERKQIARYYSFNRRMARRYERLARKKTKIVYSNMRSPEDRRRAKFAANHYKDMQEYYLEEVDRERTAI